MRILYHHRTQARGAEGVHIREIIRALRSLHHEVYVVSPPGVNIYLDRNGIKLKEAGRLGKLWRIMGRFCPQLVFELLENAYNFVAFFNLRKCIVQNNIDFIYERSSFFCWVGVFLARHYHIPIILEVNEVSGIERVRGQILTSLAKHFELHNFKRANAITVVSQFLKEHIINAMGIDNKKIFVVPNAVNPADFNMDSFKGENDIDGFIKNNRVVLGFLGGFVKWHHFDFLLNVFKRIVDDGVTNICLLMVGEGPLQNELIQMIEGRKLSQYVFFTGHVPHKKIPEYIQTMDICIIPHSNEFRSPIKLFEYMAMAKSVVAPRLEPIEAIIVDDISGKLFDDGDEMSFKNSIVDLICHQDKRQRIGIEARRIILSNHLWVHNAEKIIKIHNITR